MKTALTALGLGGIALVLFSKPAPKAMPRVTQQSKTQAEHLASLRPEVAAKAKELLGDVSAALDKKLVLVQSFRSPEEQAILYAQGRTTPGPVVTGAKPGTSYHEFGLAFDVAILDSAGKPTWPNDVALWTQIGKLGEELGLVWGGRFPSPDYDHFELHIPGQGPNA
jgi:peptidoglycan L-alanyl-D-glutamate endopeptidase CwlK